MAAADDRTRFNTEGKPTWCPGCGNFGIQASLKKALLSLDLKPHQVLMSSGIGCSGKIPHWVRINALHGLHGRTLPIAMGMKLANHDLTVIAEGGDGDGYSEGMSHFIHACRRNVDMTYIVHDNGVFGLTTGQVSPTGEKGMVSSTTPSGSIEAPFRPEALAIAGEATYVARGFCGDIDHLSGLFADGIRHAGFAFIDVLQVCVSFHPSKSFEWYRKRVYKLEDEGHDPSDRTLALARAFEEGEDRLATGVIFRASKPTYESSVPALRDGPLVDRKYGNRDLSALMKEFI